VDAFEEALVVARTSYPAVRKVLPTRLAAPLAEVALATTVLTLEGGTDTGVVVPGAAVEGVELGIEPLAPGPVALEETVVLGGGVGEAPGVAG